MNIPTLYHGWILRIAEATGLSDPVLHIHAGLAILLLVRLISRRSLGTFIPFWFVVAGEAANEILDYLHQGLQQADTLSDIGHTLFWPFVISLGVRLRPMIDRHEQTCHPGETAPKAAWRERLPAARQPSRAID